MLVHGDSAYRDVACSALRSFLAFSPFDIFVGHDDGHDGLPASPRITYRQLATDAPLPRPYRFLLKLECVSRCLAAVEHEIVVMIDADVALARPLHAAAVARACGGADFAMVEQETIGAGSMSKEALRSHYQACSLPVILPGALAPPIDAFHYFNSGVVIGRRTAWIDFLAWAQAHARDNYGRHVVGDHMVADQDYLQVWANNLHPGSVRLLPWQWNHCRHWHSGFPRPGVLFAHFSNHCEGPHRGTARRMARLTRRHKVAWNRVAAAFGGIDRIS